MEIFMNFLAHSPISQLLGGDIKGFFLDLLYILPALLIAVSFHEAAHAWMANKMGDPTARNLGRLTLDPTKHFDIWGILMFAFVGFGWGKPVPTNPRNYTNYKKGNVLVAISGVVTNLVLSFLFYGVFVLLFNVFKINVEAILYIVLNIVILNIVLCFFNLIPIPPLDGHHLVKGFIARHSPNFYMAYQRYGFYVLIALMVMTNYIQTALMFFVDLLLGLYSSFYGLFL